MRERWRYDKMGQSSCKRVVRCWYVLQALSSQLLDVNLSISDIAAVSVDQARGRWESLRGPRFDATFAALDCYTQPISKAFPPAKLVQPFDVVSMQFCMHYAFETLQKARCMLDNVTKHLRPGGVFIGTIPNADLLL